MEISAGFPGLLRSGSAMESIGDFYPFRLQCALKLPHCKSESLPMNKPARRSGPSSKPQASSPARSDGRGRPSNRTAKASDGAKPFGKAGASAAGKAGPGRSVTGPRTDAKAPPAKRGRVSAAEYVPPPRPSTRSKPSTSAAVASGPDFTGGYGEAKPRRSRVTGTRTLDLMDPTEQIGRASCRERVSSPV